MKRTILLLAVGAAAACGSLPDAGNGVVALRISTPDTLNGVGCPSSTSCLLPSGDTLTLQARALNLNGDSVAATIVWTTPDTALIVVGAATGVITSLSDTGGVARVQAGVGTLHSLIISITLVKDTTTTTPGLRQRE
ncbi:MAG: hypothetical protein ACREK8_10070 [Gemmatimonadales bacterium]